MGLSKKEILENVRYPKIFSRMLNKHKHFSRAKGFDSASEDRGVPLVK
jgi:hypothetical protein